MDQTAKGSSLQPMSSLPLSCLPGPGAHGAAALGCSALLAPPGPYHLEQAPVGHVGTCLERKGDPLEFPFASGHVTSHKKRSLLFLSCSLKVHLQGAFFRIRPSEAVALSKRLTRETPAGRDSSLVSAWWPTGAHITSRLHSCLFSSSSGAGLTNFATRPLHCSQCDPDVHSKPAQEVYFLPIIQATCSPLKTGRSLVSRIPLSQCLLVIEEMYGHVNAR